jgi:dihydroorotate dehydrogenase electron transfer subunit
MQRAEITLLEVRLDAPHQLSGVVECPPGLAPGPGQYLLAHAVGSTDPLPTVLFPSGLLPSSAGLEVAPPLPPSWSAGTRLAVRGPLGHGFSLPASTRQVALVAAAGAPYPLLPLAGAALVQGAAVALYARQVPAGLPPEVEVLPLESLADALGWADYMAIQMLPGNLTALRHRFGLAPHTPLPIPAQALVMVPMPCGGVGECGICAVATRHPGTPSGRGGWKLACKDGPVFSFNELEET